MVSLASVRPNKNNARARRHRGGLGGRFRAVVLESHAGSVCRRVRQSAGWSTRGAWVPPLRRLLQPTHATAVLRCRAWYAPWAERSRRLSGVLRGAGHAVFWLSVPAVSPANLARISGYPGAHICCWAPHVLGLHAARRPVLRVCAGV